MTATIEPATLDEVLAFQHPGVIRRFCKENNETPEAAEAIFRETVKFLYLSARAGRDGFGFSVTAEIAKLDEMWHTFLLFTRDYAEFCDRYFGVFLDHTPAEAEEEDAASPDEAETRATIERQFSYVYDVLGEETLIAWYDECRYA